MALSIKSIGQRLIIHVVENGADADLSGYTDRSLVFTKPDGTEVTKPAAVLTPPGLDGRLYVDIEQGFITTGRWTVRPVVTVDAGHVYYGDKISFVPGE